ncbi:MAG: 4Fe-4S dicluster domain-containing protein [Chloroflexi bacterium]|nr:4Fe-4S dicluster domain-containing protein [Chloroflexota bacterium]
MSKYAMLIDETRCTGCRACQVACKQWNDLPAEVTHNRGTYTNPPALSAKTWSLIEFKEIESAGKVGFYFLKHACMHCEHPACASVCPVGALHKLPEGPVVYADWKCIGCRYCMSACPFGIPTFDWGKGLIEQPLVRKCNFCIDRVSNGLTPACAKTCPSKAITFGERDQLLATGKARIRQNPERYVNRIYGETEAGGTSILYLSSVSFDQLGLPRLGSAPAPLLSEQVMGYTLPFAAVWCTALTGLALLFRFRNRGKEHAAAEPEKDTTP